MIKLFGDQNTSDLEKQLLDIDENYKLKKLTVEEYEAKRVRLIVRLTFKLNQKCIQ